MALLDRHIDFVEALRSAGIPVSLAEDVDAAHAVAAVPWSDREVLRTAYAATLLQRAAHRSSFDALFDLYFPALVGDGRTGLPGEDEEYGEKAASADQRPRDTGPALEELRDRLADALAADGGIGDGEASDVDAQSLEELAIEAVGTFGAMPGRGAGLSSWSAYQALKRTSPEDLM